VLRDKVLAAARAAGRDPDEITCAYHVQVALDGPARPGVVTGSPAQVAEQLAGFVTLGFSALSLTPTQPDRAGQVERLATEVIPAVRALR
jgi:alkanesulfonate monooxygenase SsuD/methylene tetrahydromethanopterin reductase-like flavin-dependent oxidoreductase (luciferase family)